MKFEEFKQLLVKISPGPLAPLQREKVKIPSKIAIEGVTDTQLTELPKLLFRFLRLEPEPVQFHIQAGEQLLLKFDYSVCGKPLDFEFGEEKSETIFVHALTLYFSDQNHSVVRNFFETAKNEIKEDDEVYFRSGTLENHIDLMKVTSQMCVIDPAAVCQLSSEQRAALLTFLTTSVKPKYRISVGALVSDGKLRSIDPANFQGFVSFANRVTQFEKIHVRVTAADTAQHREILQQVANQEFFDIGFSEFLIESDRFSLHFFSEIKGTWILELHGQLGDADLCVILIELIFKNKIDHKLEVRFDNYQQASPVTIRLLNSNLLFENPNLIYRWSKLYESVTTTSFQGTLYRVPSNVNPIIKERGTDVDFALLNRGKLTIHFASAVMGDNLIEPLANFCNRNKIYFLEFCSTPLNAEANYRNFNRLLSLLETVSDVSLIDCSLEDANVDSALAGLFRYKSLRSLRLSGGVLDDKLSYTGLTKVFSSFKEHVNLASIEIFLSNISNENIERLNSEKAETLKKKDNAPGKRIHSLEFTKGFKEPHYPELKKAYQKKIKVITKLQAYGRTAIDQNKKAYTDLVNDINANKDKSTLSSQEKQRIERVLLNRLSLYAYDIANGNSLLHTCALNNCVAIAAIFLARSFNVHIRNHAGQTARELAESRGYHDFVAFIDNSAQANPLAATSSTATATATAPRKRKPIEGQAQPLEKRSNTATESADAATTSHPLSFPAGASLPLAAGNVSDVSTTSHPVVSVPAATSLTRSIAAGMQATPAQPQTNSGSLSPINKFKAMICAHDYQAVKSALEEEDDISAIAINIFRSAIIAADVDIIYLLLCHPKSNQRLTAEQNKDLLELIKTQYEKPYFSSDYQQRLIRIGHLVKAHENVASVYQEAGLIWSEDLHVIYGGHYGKKKFVSIPAETIHRELKVRTDFYFFRNRTQQFQRSVQRNNLQPADDDDEMANDNDGNIVAATLTFVLSEQSNNANTEKRRVTVTIPLQANRNLLHVADHGENIDDDEHKETFKDNVVARIKPVEDMALELGARTSEEVENLFTAESNVGFVQEFHHSEQALYEYMEQEQTVAGLVSALQQTNLFRFGCKVYAVILDIHSAPNYMCGNCQLSALGEQHPTSKFLTQLTNALKALGCKVPSKFGLRMLTRVTAENPTGSKKSKEALDERRHDHRRFFVDLRFVKNDLILSKDVSTTSQSSVIFSSRPL